MFFSKWVCVWIIVMKFCMWVVEGDYGVFYVVNWIIYWLGYWVWVIEVKVVINIYGVDDWFCRIFLL